MPIGLSNPVPKYDVSTQTVGILYPSEKSLSQAREKEESQQAQLNYMSDKKPVLTAISPGKGSTVTPFINLLKHYIFCQFCALCSLPSM